MDTIVQHRRDFEMVDPRLVGDSRWMRRFADTMIVDHEYCMRWLWQTLHQVPIRRTVSMQTPRDCCPSPTCPTRIDPPTICFQREYLATSGSSVIIIYNDVINNVLPWVALVGQLVRLPRNFHWEKHQSVGESIVQLVAQMYSKVDPNHRIIFQQTVRVWYFSLSNINHY